MSQSGTSAAPRSIPQIALAVVDQIPAMVAYWDKSLTCRFANDAYRRWFGKSRAQLLGTSMQELLGPLFELNKVYIMGALAGHLQVFERSIPLPDGSGFRESIATYTPDIVGGEVLGFFVHVADTAPLKQRERELQQAIAERDQALAEVRTLRGLLCVCASCRRIRDEQGQWGQLEPFVSARTHAQFTHGLCPVCITELYPEFEPSAD